MNKKEWCDLARSYGQLRAQADAKWPPKGGYFANAPDIHDRKLIRAAELDMLDRAARLLAHELRRRRTRRFDEQRFLELVGSFDRSRTERDQLDRMIQLFEALNQREQAHVLKEWQRAIDQARATSEKPE